LASRLMTRAPMIATAISRGPACSWAKLGG
jgi:hypothetical protein